MTTGLASVFALVRAPFRFSAILTVVALALVASSCGSNNAGLLDITSTSSPHLSPTACSDGFVAHDLDHLTSGPGNTASTFDGTGAGVGIADLDNDGDLDIVLANLSESSSVLENRGNLTFERHELERGRFRGVSLVDASGDSHTDIVLTTGIGPPVMFENPGTGNLDGFARNRLEGIRAATYSMAWTDLSGDGDLDLITGSYNAELTLLRNSPVLGEDTGVVLHERTAEGFDVTRLSDTAQALALIATDIDGDLRADVLVGNDLATPDMTWLQTSNGLEPSTLFSRSSYSTMSFDAADIDNDGRNELFSTDMKPAEPDDRYREVDIDMAAAPVVDDVQTPENVLNDFDDEGFINLAEGEPVATTGWSWSGLFGDLDNDGFQDLYVATGMRSDQLFDFLPEARLVEENQAFRNNAVGGLVPIPDWGLAATEGGRGMSQADLDGDGDLDIVINNLDTPARLFENQLCGNAITIELEWPGTSNQTALGATVSASGNGTTWTREIMSSRGYLSSGPPIAHIGTGNASVVDITVTWPDGATSALAGAATNEHLTISRETD